jgi:anti-sigma B factor antagonist
MGVALHEGMARRGERVERSSGAAPPPHSRGDGRDIATLSIHITDSPGGATVVTLSGELDLSTIPRMQRPLLEQIQQRGAVLVDLSELSFIDSSGIGMLIEAKRIANGTPMGVLVGAGTQVERVFGIAGVGEAVPLFSDRDAALAALTPGRPD